MTLALTMPDISRVRSIVPMFGGATHYLETIDAVLDIVRREHPDTDALVS